MADQTAAEAAARPEAELPLPPIAALAAGTFAGAFDIAVADNVMSRRQRAWLAGQEGEEAALAALDARAAAAESRAFASLGELARAYAAPPPAEAGAFLVSGLVTERGRGRSGLIVSALDRAGRALTCAPTEAGGAFLLRIDKGEETILQVAGEDGGPLMMDDRVLRVEPGATAYVEIDLARAQKPCPDGPDLSKWTAMPDLVGKTIDEAAAAVRKAGLSLAEVKLAPDATRPGLVAATDPAAGRLLSPRAAVTLTVGADAGRFNRDLAIAILRAEGGARFDADAAVRMFTGLAERKINGLEKLGAAARRDDASFAELSGLQPKEAAPLRAALAGVTERFLALRSPEK